MKDKEQLEKLNLIGMWLCKLMVDTNADEFTHKIEGFHDKDTDYGDFVITVRRKTNN